MTAPARERVATGADLGPACLLEPGALRGVVAMIDNYDSFTYNLVQYLEMLGAVVVVLRNDAVGVAMLRAAAPAAVVVSPGPGMPGDAGISVAAVREMGTAIPVLGVCLGHQAIGEAFGARVVRAPAVMHGKVSPVEHRGLGVFDGLPSPLRAARYHSLVVDRATLPTELEVTAESGDGLVMGLRHRDLPIEGVQFHPESIASEHGLAMLRTFLGRIGVVAA